MMESFFERFIRVRARKILTLEIYGSDVFGDRPAELRSFDVLGMNGVGLEAGAIAKDRDEPGVIGTRKIKHVEADRQTLQLRNNGSKTAQQGNMRIAHFLLNVRAIFPDNNVSQHKIKG